MLATATNLDALASLVCVTARPCEEELFFFSCVGVGEAQLLEYMSGDVGFQQTWKVS